MAVHLVHRFPTRLFPFNLRLRIEPWTAVVRRHTEQTLMGDLFEKTIVLRGMDEGRAAHRDGWLHCSVITSFWHCNPMRRSR
jgi:hypothetical protein